MIDQRCCPIPLTEIVRNNKHYRKFDFVMVSTVVELRRCYARSFKLMPKISSKPQNSHHVHALPLSYISSSLFVRSNNGLFVVVKDPQRFHTEIISRFFKYKHYSMFYRRLRSYGFRFLSNDIAPCVGDTDATTFTATPTRKYWVFYHQFFQRDHPEFLSMIHLSKERHRRRTSMRPKTAEVTNLRTEVRRMQSEVTFIARDLAAIKTLLLMVCQQSSMPIRVEADHDCNPMVVPSDSSAYAPNES